MTKYLAKLIIDRYGLTNHPLYRYYRYMMNRCYKVSNQSYDNYGGRGITVCQDWIDNPKQFIYWAEKNGYKKGLMIDRKNNSKGYFPDNCRFVGSLVQNNNRRMYKNNTSGFTGVRSTNYNTFQARVKSNGKQLQVGNFPTALEASVERDKFIEKHNLMNKKGA